jgi:hypothetical protein
MGAEIQTEELDERREIREMVVQLMGSDQGPSEPVRENR